MFAWVFAGYSALFALFITPLFLDPIAVLAGDLPVPGFLRGAWVFCTGWIPIITTAFGEATFSLGYDHSNAAAFFAVPIYGAYLLGMLLLILVVPTERGVPPVAELLMNLTHVDRKAELSKSMNANPSSPTFDATKFYGAGRPTSQTEGEAQMRSEQLQDHISTVDTALSGLREKKASLNRARAKEAELEAELNRKIEEAERLKAELQAERTRRF